MPPAPDATIEKAPPSNLEAETSLLGALILDPGMIGEVIELVRPEQFFKAAHQILFQIIRDLHDARRGVDLVTITNTLEERGELQAAGGPDYVASLVDGVHSSASAVHHARIVHNKSRLRRLQDVCRRILGDIQDPTEEAEDLIDGAEKQIFDAVQKKDRHQAASIGDILHSTFRELSDIKDGKKPAMGVPTGFYELDDLIGGLRKSQLLIVAGRPGMGKSSLAIRMAEHVGLVEKKPVLFFSMEMDRQNIAQNMICSHCRVSPHNVRKGLISDEDWQHLLLAAGNFEQAPIFIDDSPNLSMLELRARARRMKAEHDIQAIFLDYLQFMETRDLRKAENRQQEIAQISRQLKELAREMEVPVVALSQLNRATEQNKDMKPKLSDLRESGAIEQDADVVMLLYRSEYYDREGGEKGVCDVNVAKQRNGPTGEVKLAFIGDLMRFENLAHTRST